MSTNNSIDTELLVGEDHPGRGFAYFKKNASCKIPLVSIPDGFLCQIKDLHLGSKDVTPEVNNNRERYAKTALIMFYPFRCLEDLQTEGSYWKRFDACRTHHFENNGKHGGIDSHNANSATCSDICFWEKGFEILQNMEEQLTVSKNNVRTVDRLTSETTYDENGEEDAQKKGDEDAVKDVQDISFFCGEDESSDNEEESNVEEKDWNYSHTALIKQANATHNRLVNTRQSSSTSLFPEDRTNNKNDNVLSDTSDNISDQNSNDERHTTLWNGVEGFDTVLKLVRGTLLGGDQYSDVYAEIDITDQDDDDYFRCVSINSKSLSSHPDFVAKVPTLSGVARMVAREEGTILDEKQYIMYEVLVCTFLLDLINKQELDGESALAQKLSGALGTTRSENMDEVIKILKARGGRDQLIMFVTGLAGAGKSTAINVAQRFCFEFCKAASVMWKENTFFFTAYTGSAAAAFGGLTTSSGIYLNKDDLTDTDRQMFEGVRILVIDEVSFLKDSELKTMMKHLQNIGDSHKPFGGYNIVFGGDFQQMKPVNVSDNEILWHPSSSKRFEQHVNCVIILEGMHRFRDDRRYGDMLKRLCAGELTEDDIKWINTRVLGCNGLELPKDLEGDACYACWKNMERNSITAALFEKHLQATHPPKNSKDLPPSNTLIIEAGIESRTECSKKKFRSLRRRILELGDDDVKQQRTLVDPCLRCYPGAFFMCNSNERLRDKGTGNGTQCRLLYVILNDNATSYTCKIWNKRKVWTVCANDVKYLEFEHFPKTQEIKKLELLLEKKQQEQNQANDNASETTADIKHIKSKLDHALRSRRFKLSPKSFGSCLVKVAPNDFVSEKQTMKCKINQIPVNSSDAITGHKLQGLTKDQLIVYSWNKSTSWIYVVLSRVRTLKGLFLLKRLRLRDIKPPSKDYLAFMERMKKIEKIDLDRTHKQKRR